MRNFPSSSGNIGFPKRAVSPATVSNRVKPVNRQFDPSRVPVVNQEAETTFDYGRAFQRNIGLLTESEQNRLRKATVALPGLGGVGGFHMEILARMGVGAFHLADPDIFEVANIQRQIGATSQSMGKSKAEIIAARALSINPEIQLKLFPEGVTDENLDEFLEGVDLVVDGVEFFAYGARSSIFKRAREKGIPVITAGPIGYGAALLVFTPEGPTFENFFGIKPGMTTAEKLAAFAVGLNPRMGSDIDPRYIDFEKRRGPALSSACAMCSAAAATEAMKILTGRKQKLAAAPNGIYIDPYRLQIMSLRSTRLWRWLKRKIVLWAFLRQFPSMRKAHEAELAARNSK
jgi:molybdopterin/thiamine biosynthesis adenylyltransferase